MSSPTTPVVTTTHLESKYHQYVDTIQEESPSPNFKQQNELWLSDDQRKNLIQACFLSVAAILGTLMRILLAQLFGEECKNPGTVGWLKASSPLCVTADGSTEAEGGIVFADLPSNLLGCFLMGLMQDGIKLGLAIPLPVVWLQPLSNFQSLTLIHTAIKTGFCGSLTTFSSWNSEMVVLIFGTGNNRSTNFWSAIFGYIIGMETALGSYVFGTTVARWLHELVNPVLANEARAMKRRESEGIFIHRELPEFERRFLHDLQMIDVLSMNQPESLTLLSKWRHSTWEARRVGNPMLKTLYDLEKTILVDCEKLSPYMVQIAREQGWELDALLQWVVSRNSKDAPKNNSRLTVQASGVLHPRHHGDSFSAIIASTIIAIIVLPICFGVMKINHEEKYYLLTYRTMLYAMLFAPAGALLRWTLSKWNGKLPTEKLGWLPAGTFAANILGSIVSISMIALEVRRADIQNFWFVGTLRALKVGFAGCLTTVSTFISEVHSLFHANHHDRGYFYALITLGTSSVVGVIIYAYIVFI